MNHTDLSGQVAVVNGASRGIGEAIARGCHAGKLDEIEALFGFIRKEFERVDILINNAATNPYYGPAAGLSPVAFDKTVQVNLKGPYFMTSAAIPLMIESGGGSVVNVASVAALKTLPGQAVYSMTKAGLISLTRSFASEYGQQGIRVNAILPGVVKTRFASAMTEDPSIQKWLSRLPVPRAGEPDEMVAGVLYLVSDQASYTTGTTLVMDGGALLS
jgi:NAD(P)-dependent dehydrogenase (short-subunit alcohol dehydrogenase family)